MVFILLGLRVLIFKWGRLMVEIDDKTKISLYAAVALLPVRGQDSDREQADTGDQWG